MHGHHLVEAAGLAVGHERLEHGRLQTGVAPLRERMPDVCQIRDPRLLEVRKVVAVVHDAHRVGLDEPHPNPVGELVVAGVGRRFG